MFTFVLWDQEKKILFLCRDRMGEKPLYFGLNGDQFIFVSELKQSSNSHSGKLSFEERPWLNLGYIPDPNVSGKKNHKNELWAVCMFQAWLDEYRKYLELE